MPIAPADIAFRRVNSATRVVSGKLHDLIPAGVVDGPTDYWWVEVVNTHQALTWTTPKAWLELDAGGAAVSLAVADPVARPPEYGYGPPDPTSLTYSTPTSFESGLTLPDLTPGTPRVLLAIQRVLTGASPDYPDANVLRVRGKSLP